MRLYKIEVDAWPTSDGKPWPHFVVPKMAAECPPWEHGVESWMPVERDEDGWSGMERFQKWEGLPVGVQPDDWWDYRDERPPEFCGWILPTPWAGPKIRRSFWVSRAGARRWLADAATLGAKARLIPSAPITWED